MFPQRPYPGLQVYLAKDPGVVLTNLMFPFCGACNVGHRTLIIPPDLESSLESSLESLESSERSPRESSSFRRSAEVRLVRYWHSYNSTYPFPLCPPAVGSYTYICCATVCLVFTGCVTGNYLMFTNSEFMFNINIILTTTQGTQEVCTYLVLNSIKTINVLIPI